MNLSINTRWALKAQAIFVLTFSLLLTACQSEKPRESVRIRTGDRSFNGGYSNNGYINNNGSPGEGQVRINAQGQSPEQALFNFLGREVPGVIPQSLRFSGIVTFNGGMGINQALQYGGNLSVDQRSGIDFVYDDTASANGQEAPFVFSMEATRAQVQGNSITLFFNDQFGSVVLNGGLNGNVYSGQIDYTNNSTANYVNLGTFDIAVCSLFQCN